jgi:hypothetical protein
VLIDSEAEESFMDNTLVSELGIPTHPLFIPMNVRALEWHSIGRVTHTTCPIKLRVSGNHSESMQFLPIESPHTPVVLGFSWLSIDHKDLRHSTTQGGSPTRLTFTLDPDLSFDEHIKTVSRTAFFHLRNIAKI